MLSQKVIVNDNSSSTESPSFSIYTLSLCSMISNGKVPMREGDEVDYKYVDTGEQDEDDLLKSINSMIYALPKIFRANRKSRLQVRLWISRVFFGFA